MKKRKWLQKVLAVVLVVAMCFGAVPANGLGNVVAKAADADTTISLVNGDFANDIWGENDKGWDVTAEGNYTVSSTSTVGELNFYRKAAGTITLTQEVPNLPEGKYQLSAEVKGENATIAFSFGENTDANATTIASSNSYVKVTSDEFTQVTSGAAITVGFVLDINAEGWGYVDNVTLKKLAEADDGSQSQEKEYKINIVPSTETPVVGTTFTLTANITCNGETVTELADAGLQLWWWFEGEDAQSTWLKNYDNTNGTTTDLQINVTQKGTYKLKVELQERGTQRAIEDYDLSIAPDANAAVGGVTVAKVEKLPDDFIMGMDISSIISEFESGVTFKDYDGNTINNVTDFCKFLATQGITHIRVRVWNDPYDANGNGYGGGNNDVAKAKEIADACRAAGLKMLVDFHCSDLWTDPSKYQAPKAWKNYTVDQKATALTAFLADALTTIDADKDTVAMVQVGNETTGGFVGEKNPENMCKLFSAGSAGVRAYNSEVKVVIHVTNPEKGNVTGWAKKLNDNSVDYDILATSYYPYWHGTLKNLKNEFKTVKEKYSKDVMVAETSYAYTLVDSDGHDNTVRVGNNDTGSDTTEPFTVQGQATSIRNLINAVNEVGGLGVYYWEPAWLTVGDVRGLEGEAYDAQVAANKATWERYGSGWASSYAAEYDADDAGKWFGGAAVDNEAMFYPDGTPTESLPVWKYVRTGSVSAMTSLETIGTVEELNQTYTLGSENAFTMPETITAVYGKEDRNVTKAETVTWNEKEAAMLTNAVSEEKAGIYKVTGTVALSEEITSGAYKGTTTMEVVYTLSVLAPNLITDVNDAGFESKTNFVVTDKEIIELPSKDDPYAGTYSMHWYSATAATEGAVYTKGITLQAGSYAFEAKAQGFAGDLVSVNILDAAENGNVLFAGEAATMDGWSNWQIPKVSFTLEEETTVYLQITVDMQAGGWGTADALYLYETEASGEDSGNDSPGTTPSTPSQPSAPTDTVAPNVQVITNPDGSTTEIKKVTDTNAAGNTVEKTTTTQMDVNGKVTGTTEVSEIPAVTKTTSATVTVEKDAAGAVTSAEAEVVKTGASSESGVKATLYGSVVSQITDAAGVNSVKVTMTVVDKKGEIAYTVSADTTDLKAGNKLAVVAVDKKTGEYVLVNGKSYKVSKSGNVKVTLKEDAAYELLTTAEMKAVEKEILGDVKVKKSSVTVKKGKKTTVELSDELNMDNVKKITYTTSKKSVATVDKNGKITAKKAGTVIIKVKVTLNNGATKVVKMKVKVK